MPWTTPTLKEVRTLTRDYVLSQLGARAMIPNSVLRIMSDAKAGLAHLTLLYIDWLAKQLLPDTAETEWLDRHGNIWLKNADGSIGRKGATFASGQVMITGTEGTVIPAGTILAGPAGLEYQTVAEAVIGEGGTSVTAEALTAGIAGNLESGTSLATSGLYDAVTAGDMTGGTEVETDEQLRERVLFRIQQPPMGGAKHDYEAWALAVPGVTRAWSAPLEMGIGTVTVRFMMDDLRAADGGFPNNNDILAVETYLDSQRPVVLKDRFVVAPLPQPIDFYLLDLVPDTPAVRGQIEAEIADMLIRKAAPGQTIFAAWKYSAIMSAAGVKSFKLTNTADDVMTSPGHMAVLGDIFYGVT